MGQVQSGAKQPLVKKVTPRRSRLRRIAASIPGVPTLYRTVINTAERAQLTAEFRRFRQMSAGDDRFPQLRWSQRMLRTGDRQAVTEFGTHYVYHPAWAARILMQTRPEHHIDIASSLHFASMVSAFLPVTFYDYRPAPLKLSNLQSLPGDLMALPLETASVSSLSCMHVLEHVGLGRYGDPLDPIGDRKAMAELSRVLAPGGNLLVVTPVGRPVIRFNAHRIYSGRQIVDAFPGLELKEFSLIPDTAFRDGMIHNAPLEATDLQDYGCGCFWFQRPA